MASYLIAATQMLPHILEQNGTNISGNAADGSPVSSNQSRIYLHAVDNLLRLLKEGLQNEK